MNEVVHVAVAVIRNQLRQVLVTRRASHVHQGGLWEFPGGKLESGESVEQALVREIREELNLVIQQAYPLVNIRHDYPDKTVQLDVWEVRRFSGEPEPQEGQPMQWIPVEALDPQGFPVANHRIIKNLQLPESVMITGPYESFPELEKKLVKALENNVNHVHFRAHWLADNVYVDHASKILAIAQKYNARLILSRDAAILAKVQADGIHLTSSQLATISKRPEINQLVSASCHHREEIIKCQQLGIDYCFLSPVMKTMSHENVDPLGWQRFSEIVSGLEIPVYALGGMRQEDMEQARLCGARGIASISDFWSHLD